MLGYAGICWDVIGYGKIWWDMVGCAGMCWDMVGHGGIWGGGLHVVSRPCTCFAKVSLLSPWFLHLLRKLFTLKRASRFIAKTGFF